MLSLQVTHSCAYSHNSLPRHQSCSRDIEDGLRGGRWVAAQKPPQQPAGGDPESNRGCPGPMTSRGETHTLDIEPGQGPVSTKVQSSWSNGRSRAQWEKNPTCFEVIKQANRHAQVPASLSTTGATQLQTLAHLDTLGRSANLQSL